MTLERLGAAIGWPLEDVETALGQQTSAERDDEGRLVGLALTLRPTPHRFTLNGRALFAWCASDTMMFPLILDSTMPAWPTCPQTGRPIRVELTPDGIERLEPPHAVVSAVRPTGRLADLRTATCHDGHFFSCAAATAQWAREHSDGYIQPVEESFRLDHHVITQLAGTRRRATSE